MRDGGQPGCTAIVSSYVPMCQYNFVSGMGRVLNQQPQADSGLNTCLSHTVVVYLFIFSFEPTLRKVTISCINVNLWIQFKNQKIQYDRATFLLDDCVLELKCFLHEL